MGEVAARLLKDHAVFLDQQPQIPWRNMKGMHNHIAHGYFDINLEVVWQTVQTALPPLLQDLPVIRSMVP